MLSIFRYQAPIPRRRHPNLTRCNKARQMQQMLQMVGDDSAACQVVVRLTQDQVGFIEWMLYTAILDETATFIHNDYSHFILFVLILWLHKYSI